MDNSTQLQELQLFGLRRGTTKANHTDNEISCLLVGLITNINFPSIKLNMNNC